MQLSKEAAHRTMFMYIVTVGLKKKTVIISGKTNYETSVEKSLLFITQLL